LPTVPVGVGVPVPPAEALPVTVIVTVSLKLREFCGEREELSDEEMVTVGLMLGLPEGLCVIAPALLLASSMGEGVETKLGELLWLGVAVDEEQMVGDREELTHVDGDPWKIEAVGFTLEPVGDQEALPLPLASPTVGVDEAVPSGLVLGLEVTVTVEHWLLLMEELWEGVVVGVKVGMGVWDTVELWDTVEETVGVLLSWREPEGLAEAKVLRDETKDLVACALPLPTPPPVTVGGADTVGDWDGEPLEVPVDWRFKEGLAVGQDVESEDGEGEPVRLPLLVCVAETVPASGMPIVAVPCKEGDTESEAVTHVVKVGCNMVGLELLERVGVLEDVRLPLVVPLPVYEGVPLGVREALVEAVTQAVEVAEKDVVRDVVIVELKEEERQAVGEEEGQRDTEALSLAAVEPLAPWLAEAVEEADAELLAVARGVALGLAVKARLPVTLIEGECEGLREGLSERLGEGVPEGVF
jgi:hypothetical protein